MVLWPLETIQEAPDMRGTPLRRNRGILILGIALLFPHMGVGPQGIITGAFPSPVSGKTAGPADLPTFISRSPPRGR